MEKHEDWETLVREGVGDEDMRSSGLELRKGRVEVASERQQYPSAYDRRKASV
jgi:hypothetical protein